MPGRQAHGRSLLAAPKAQPARKGSKARSQKNALNAFGIAQERFPTKTKRTPRVRELEASLERKHGREEKDEEEEEGEGEEDESERPRKKRVKQTDGEGDVEFGSDSDGNEWQLGGMADDDDDSEIESDDAFGESDDDKFEGYSFGGSKQKKKKADVDSDEEDDDDSQDDQGETLGDDAIDLATALDQYESDSDEAAEEQASGSEDEDSEDDSELDSDEDEDDEDSEADPDRLEALQGLVTEYGGQDKDVEKQQVTSKPKIDLSDLGLSSISDPHMKQSLKLMKKEEKEKRPGQSQKLEVPLARREQAKLDRSAAFDKTNETLERWTETVKQNRRADHLVFPLPENSDSFGVNRSEIQPLTLTNPSNELESTIMSIMEQSGLSMDKEQKPKEKVYDDDGNELTRKQILNQKRLERELATREAKRAARIKKIKSKAYHRVHRRQQERDDMATREAMEEAGEIDSDAEREAQDRGRALERMGLRHKDSKWAKLGNKNKRAVWDDDFRAGLTEMARKDEELRKRKEGKVGDLDDESSSGDSGEDEDDRLRRQLDELDQEEDEGPHSKLMGLKFMRRAEEAKKKANDEMVRQIRRELDGKEDDEDEEDDGENQAGEVGRKSYGAPGKMSKPALDTSRRAPKQQPGTDADGVPTAEQLSSGFSKPNISSSAAEAPSTGGAWSSGPSRRKTKSTPAADLDLTSNILVASKPKLKPAPSSSKSPAKGSSAQEDDSDATSSSGSDSDSDSDSRSHHPLSIRDTDLISRAFASDDVYAPFAAEKAALEAADAPRTVDTTLPGWGSWVGDGLSAREAKRAADRRGRFTKEVAGLDPSRRKDRGMDRVIINEKRVKKNDKFLASGLPHPFESREQYERSLRLPVGREWMTKEVVQDGTKPRVLVGQGIITPMAKPSR